MRLIPQQVSPESMPSHFNLGETDAEISFNSAEDNKNAAIALVRQGHFSLHLYTQDLDPAVINNEEFSTQLIKMIKNYKEIQIQILVRDSSKVVKGSHIIHKLAQQISSHIQVRNIPDAYADVKGSFMIVDRVGFYYRLKATEPQGTVNFNSPGRARKLLEHFSRVWDQSIPDPHFKKLHL